MLGERVLNPLVPFFPTSCLYKYYTPASEVTPNITHYFSPIKLNGYSHMEKWFPPQCAVSHRHCVSKTYFLFFMLGGQAGRDCVRVCNIYVQRIPALSTLQVFTAYKPSLHPLLIITMGTLLIVNSVANHCIA